MRRAVEWALRLALGAVFVVAGALKLADPAAFATEIANYHFFPTVAPLAAATLPATELVVGAALIAAPARWRRAAVLAAIALLVVFTVAVTQVVARKINVECGCFGSASGPVTLWTVARDLALLAGAGLLAAISPRDPV